MFAKATEQLRWELVREVEDESRESVLLRMEKKRVCEYALLYTPRRARREG